MHPVIVEIGWFSVYSFGFMLAISFLAGIYISTHRAKSFGIDPQHVLDLSVWLIVAGVVGSRLLYVVFHLGEYNSFLDIFALWQGGATLFGGFLLAIFAAYVYTKKRNINFLSMCDVLSPAFALGIMVTRVGCYMSGCCYGKETSLPFGVIFPPDSAAGVYCRQLATTPGEAVTLHPSQLYASTYGFVIFLILMLARKKLKKNGATLGAFLAMYGVCRFGLDFSRYYEPNMRMLFDLTLNQWISVGLVIFGLFLLFRKTTARAKVAA